MNLKHLLLLLSATVLAACSSNGVVLDYNDSAPQTQAKTLLLPVLGPGGEDEMEKVLERALLASFSTIPGAEAARKVGLYDQLRSKWTKAVEQLGKGAQGAAMDVVLQEAFAKLGELTGVDSILVSKVGETASAYENGDAIHLACGLWDINSRQYAWIAQFEGKKGVIPVPLEVFAVQCATAIKDAVEAERLAKEVGK